MLQVDATPIIDFRKSFVSNPTAWSIALAGARSTDSVMFFEYSRCSDLRAAGFSRRFLDFDAFFVFVAIRQPPFR